MLQNAKLLEGLTSDETTEVLIIFYWKTMTSHENDNLNCLNPFTSVLSSLDNSTSSYLVLRSLVNETINYLARFSCQGPSRLREATRAMGTRIYIPITRE